MKMDFAQAMRRATSATRTRDLVKATSIIQDALAGRPQSNEEEDETSSAPGHDLTMPRLASVGAERPDAAPTADATDRPSRKQWPLGQVVRFLRGVRTKSPPSPALEPAGPPPVPDSAQFVTRSFSCAAGARTYKLYIPGSTPRGLIVMLHGCKQNPDDFATGTNMNAIAEAHGLLVAYPRQARSANVSSCWNWFNPADQRRDAGEPSIIAGITREIVHEFGLDRKRVFVAGLSAGGAMAAVLAETYPDLYAAAGIHSGLAYRAANDVMSAFAAMKGQPEVSPPTPRNRPSEPQPHVRTIVFHGDQDQTVHPSNADRVAEAALAGIDAQDARRDGFEGGRRHETTVFSGADGVPVVELWRIHGAGHAWSGGNRHGSFTDANGPNASAEMVRFFLDDATIQ